MIKLYAFSGKQDSLAFKGVHHFLNWHSRIIYSNIVFDDIPLVTVNLQCACWGT